ncbi:hypothetical protein QPK87_06910 [Kamptonema cortianum]|nr:hypothetical protein [Geitlerinema splendidum]MDK3156303.1 hypothetical protein [Kamptonema cortianum]
MRGSIVLLASLLFVGILGGCSKAEENQETTVNEPAVQETSTNTAEDATTLTTFQTPSGKLVCPIMKSEIPNEDAAYGYVVHEGVKYLVCCEPCEKAGKADPAALAAKAQELK